MVKIKHIPSENSRNDLAKFLNFVLNDRQNFANFWIWSGAKVFKTCRSRKVLSNEYLDLKIGVDTAENEPSKVL